MLRDFVPTPEGSTKYGKEKPIPATAKRYQIVKATDTMKKLHQLMGKITSWHHNKRIEFIHITLLTLNANEDNNSLTNKMFFCIFQFK